VIVSSETNKPEVPIMKKNFFLIPAMLLIFLIAVPFVSAASTMQYNAADYLTSLTDGLVALFNGDTDGFTRGLVGSLPLFAVFIIVMGLIMYISSQVIFREEGTHKYAVLLGIGMALITMMTPAIFNWIMGLGRITIMIILAVTFFALVTGFHKKTSTSLSGLNGVLASARKNEYTEINDMNKIKQDMKVEKGLEDKENADLKEANKLVNEMQSVELGIKEGLNKIMNTIIRLNGVRDVNSKAAFIQTIQNQLSSINGKLKTQRVYLDGLTKRSAALGRDMRIEKGKLNESAILNKLIREAGKTPGKGDDILIQALQKEFSDLEKFANEEIMISNEIQKLVQQERQDYEKTEAGIIKSMNYLSLGNGNGSIQEIREVLRILDEYNNINNTIKGLNRQLGVLQINQNQVEQKIRSQL
jgi:hypothetical protein